MNYFHTEVGPILAKDLKDSWHTSNFSEGEKSNFKVSFILENAIKKVEVDIEISKSSAMDNLSSGLLKDALKVLAFKLAYLFHSCISRVIFPKA